MKKSTRRRLTFQLTPLLDLLLIVIFAQYMEAGRQSEIAQAQTRAAARELVDAARQEFRSREAELESEYQVRLNTLDESVREARSQQAQLQERMAGLIKQHQQAGETLAAAFDLPQRLTERIATLREDGRMPEADELESAAQSVRKALQSLNGNLMQFAVRYDEMQKHVSVWEVHIADNGTAEVSDGEQRSEFEFESAGSFVSGALDCTKAFTEPKPLTLVLLSYGNAQERFHRAARDAMPELMTTLRADAGGSRWFDYSLMGYRPEGPVFDRDSPDAGPIIQPRTAP